jgi:hypothetical protein
MRLRSQRELRQAESRCGEDRARSPPRPAGQAIRPRSQTPWAHPGRRQPATLRNVAWFFLRFRFRNEGVLGALSRESIHRARRPGPYHPLASRDVLREACPVRGERLRAHRDRRRRRPPDRIPCPFPSSDAKSWPTRSAPVRRRRSSPLNGRTSAHRATVRLSDT